MIWEDVNFLKNPELLDKVKNGDTLILGNLSQTSEDIDILPGRKDLTLIRVNAINCIFDKSTTMKQCNTARNKYVPKDQNDIKRGLKVLANKGKREFAEIKKEKLASIFSDGNIKSTVVRSKFKKEIKQARLKNG